MSVGFKRNTEKERENEIAAFKSKKGFVQKGVDDLVMLPKIDENEIVDNLKKRYNYDAIYTNIGPVLIVINPFKDLGLTTDEYVHLYKGEFRQELPPHIFALSEETYRNMKNEKCNQCCIISGESGAGKTVAAKQIMQYIAAVSGGNEEVVYVKNVILDSNPLLEAFGNAKTLRNNNSSRFGKYFEINFDDHADPVGGTITNYLLEESRVCTQQTGERNYHIFYQLLAGAPENYYNDFYLTTPGYFVYTNQSNCMVVDGIDDKKDYADCVKAMNTIGISADEQYWIFQLVAAILHLGNVYFTENSSGYAEITDKSALETAAYLLEVDPGQLEHVMLVRKLTTGVGARAEVFDSPLTVEQAEATKNAIAKEIYDRIFTMLVQKVNIALQKHGIEHQCVIGILDIFGFEIFPVNGFEQFCINYVNEKLQQYFIELTLKTEQEEYLAEGIKWTPIKYFNNKVVCDLIEGKNPPGMFSLLDDICATMHAQTEGADFKFLEKCCSVHSTNQHFIPSGETFTVQHYAGPVSYYCEGFCEKNKDTLFLECVECLQTSNNQLLYDLFPWSAEQEAAKTGQKKRPTTAGFKIKTSANELMAALSQCQPHYIRCIKPNETKKPQDWDADRVKHQVKYLGLLENVKVRRAGFAYRAPFARFLQTYKKYHQMTWGTWGEWTGDAKEGCRLILEGLTNIEPGQWQFGTTKLFIRLPESIFAIEEMLEKMDFDKAVEIQKAWKGYRNRKRSLSQRAEAASILKGKKERRRESVDYTNNKWTADYINYENEIPFEEAMEGHMDELVNFDDWVMRLNKKGKIENRALLLTDKAIYIAQRQIKKKVLKYIVTFRGDLSQISEVVMSTMQDNFMVIRVRGAYDSVLLCPHKTEFLMMLLENYRALMNGQSFPINFSDSISFRGKDEKKDKLLVFKKDDGPKTLPVEEQKSFSKHVLVRTGLPKETDTTPGSYNSSVSSYAAPTASSSNNYSAPPMKSAPPAPQVAAPPPPKPKLPQVKALYPYTAANDEELSFKVGDIITILEKDEGWWKGELNGQEGWIPNNYVKEI
uniref:Unconventional myosin IB n=1 Tax=Entamoeba histolytica TaxID=5759 RepID=O00851_ENTHI|nr:unconventional myosin IB [Entamoeba histolytica]